MFEWITANHTNLLAAVGAAMALGGILVKLTPTKKDDEWYQKIKGALGGVLGGKK
jgi:predicted phage tail protein